MTNSTIIGASVAAFIAAAGWMTVRAQEPIDAVFDSPEVRELPVSDPQCTFFGPQHDKFVRLNSFAKASDLTARVMTQMAAIAVDQAAATIPSAPGGSRTSELQRASTNTIDKYIFDALTEKGITPAPPTTDFEFIRRAYLDLTGRIPTGN